MAVSVAANLIFHVRKLERDVLWNQLTNARIRACRAPEPLLIPRHHTASSRAGEGLADERWRFFSVPVGGQHCGLDESSSGRCFQQLEWVKGQEGD